MFDSKVWIKLTALLILSLVLF